MELFVGLGWVQQLAVWEGVSVWGGVYDGAVALLVSTPSVSLGRGLLPY